MKSYKDLIVWQKAMDLVVKIYRIAESLPQSERYGLVSQIERAAVSIPSNIAEGSGRSSRKDFVKFLYTSRGSLYEVETQLHIMQSLGYIDDNSDLLSLVSEVARMLSALINSLANEDLGANSKLETRNSKLEAK